MSDWIWLGVLAISAAAVVLIVFVDPFSGRANGVAGRRFGIRQRPRPLGGPPLSHPGQVFAWSDQPMEPMDQEGNYRQLDPMDLGSERQTAPRATVFHNQQEESVPVDGFRNSLGEKWLW